MSQTDIYAFLKANPGKTFCAREIAQILNINKCSVTTNVGKLVDSKSICYDEIYLRHPKGLYLTRMYHCDMHRDCVRMGCRKPPTKKVALIQRQFSPSDCGSYKTQTSTSSMPNCFGNHRI